ncbi:uncharacterized protein Z518_06740 [Rhinocladiella mackenziei CBS 650.93]|uniref:Rhinocladiella mackenziei CBS 650.93 unplaced genomic scaffold supercont1.5, whole genome shotgun sequence n=1 Tax=Rhinocladiella mackenziei CBS 650.93 TaxID=1442369 RepID=A0A0D2GY92_9EURO|nr:uncharacterized protein Z518_06740 [Rhinocladiella mackenziei CBS 650.93]KIX03188.1 hypothetical protein Z518_06740 [Rhinocladiella mackenziei CBS 650.93]
METGDTKKRQAEDEPSAASSSSGKRARIANSCQWINNEKIYKDWIERKNGVCPILWVHGPPGSGKTFLSRFVADTLRASSEQPATACYFCEEASSLLQIVRSVLEQLAGHVRTTPSGRDVLVHAIDELAARKDSAAASPDAIWDLFTTALQGVSTWNLVIDGVDELQWPILSEQEFNFTHRLRRLASGSSGAGKLYVSSRTLANIRHHFHNVPTIVLTQDKLEDDIKTFASDLVDGHPHLGPYKDVIVRSLVKGADGIFTWVEVSVQSLALETTEEGIIERLNNLPPASTDLYAAIITKQSERLTWTDLQIRNAILRWTVNAIHPLNVLELSNAVSVSTNAFVAEVEEKAVAVCDGLVKIEGGKVRAMHHSLLDFLRSSHESAAAMADVHGAAGHASIAIACLRYLSHPAFAVPSGIDTTNEFPKSSYPLLEYAALYWVHHVTQADRTNKELQSLITQFFDGSTAFVWLDCLLPAFFSRSVLPIPPRPKNSARFFHLFTLKSQLVKFFDQDEPKADFDRKISGFLSSSYERALADARADASPNLETSTVLQRTLDLGEVYGWLPDQRSRSETLFAEAFSMAQRLKLANELSLDISLEIATYQAQADALKRGGKYNEARTILEQLVQLIQPQPSTPPMESSLMFALDSLGWVCMRLGSLADAAAHLSHGLQLATKLSGTTSSLTLRSKITLAEVLMKLHRAQEAEALCQQLVDQLDSHREIGIPLPRDSISHLNTLAAVYMAQGKFAQAVQTFSMVVEDRTATFGGDHPMTLWATMQLGLAMEKASTGSGELLALFDNLVMRQEKVLGTQHPDVNTSREALSRVQGAAA